MAMGKNEIPVLVNLVHHCISKQPQKSQEKNFDEDSLPEFHYCLMKEPL